MGGKALKALKSPEKPLSPATLERPFLDPRFDTKGMPNGVPGHSLLGGGFS
jgi:hypothetical protein